LSDNRKNAADKWNAMSPEEKVKVITSMVNKGLIPAIIPGKGKSYQEQIAGRVKDGHDVDYGSLNYAVREKISKFLL